MSAPSDRWAPGIEELVLGRASALAIAGLGANVDRWEPSAVQHIESRYEQTLRGVSSTNTSVWIRHVLAFAGSDHRVMFCCVGCYGAPQCENVVRSATLHGADAGVPPPSLLVRAVLLAAQKPYETSGLTAIVVLFAITVLLRFRRRVPARSFFP
ncbi:MAG: hypothetical protein IPK82_38575 [Polyangiaceae bacterium]|nr:hypothetical protein [Polyangiaceae bacterium]